MLVEILMATAVGQELVIYMIDNTQLAKGAGMGESSMLSRAAVTVIPWMLTTWWIMLRA